MLLPLWRCWVLLVVDPRFRVTRSARDWTARKAPRNLTISRMPRHFTVTHAR
ncbi:MAG TPA: hypothetical protein PLV68_15270 [Ilumatobacteraceae bacterium]|nr:hypothetical protein [Ilumatobacteraceae bacterium]